MYMNLTEREHRFLIAIRRHPESYSLILDFLTGRIDEDTFNKAFRAVQDKRREADAV